MRGVILAGGFGSRMQPSTKVTNKHLLPVYSEQGAIPMLFYPIHTMVSSGIEDILIISSREHCGHIIENLSDGQDFGADFSFKVQDLQHVQLGIASALKLAKNFTNNEKFAVCLGDNFFEDSFSEEVKNFECQWPSEPLTHGIVLDRYKAAVFLKEVDDVRRFGCATLDAADRVVKIVEKPGVPESNLAVTGLYFYTHEVYDVADELKPSARGELEITHINDHYCQEGTAVGYMLEGHWSDMGVPTSMTRVQEWIAKNDFTIGKTEAVT